VKKGKKKHRAGNGRLAKTHQIDPDLAKFVGQIWLDSIQRLAAEQHPLSECARFVLEMLKHEERVEDILPIAQPITRALPQLISKGPAETNKPLEKNKKKAGLPAPRRAA